MNRLWPIALAVVGGGLVGSAITLAAAPPGRVKPQLCGVVLRQEMSALASQLSTPQEGVLVRMAGIDTLDTLRKLALHVEALELEACGPAGG